MSQTVFTLSARGRSALQAPSADLPAHMSNLLGLVDGHRTRQELITLSGKASLSAGALRWLMHAGYIEPRAPGARAEVVAHVSATPTHAAAGSALDALDDPHERFMLFSSFLTEIIRQHLGLRGLPQQFKVERAGTLEELIARVAPIAEAIERAEGQHSADLFLDAAKALLQPLH